MNFDEVITFINKLMEWTPEEKEDRMSLAYADRLSSGDQFLGTPASAPVVPDPAPSQTQIATSQDARGGWVPGRYPKVEEYTPEPVEVPKTVVEEYTPEPVKHFTPLDRGERINDIYRPEPWRLDPNATPPPTGDPDKKWIWMWGADQPRSSGSWSLRGNDIYRGESPFSQSSYKAHDAWENSRRWLGS